MLWQLPSRAHHVNLFYLSLTFQCLLIVYLDAVQDLYHLHWGKIPLGTYFMRSQLFLGTSRLQINLGAELSNSARTILADVQSMVLGQRGFQTALSSCTIISESTTFPMSQVSNGA